MLFVATNRDVFKVGGGKWIFCPPEFEKWKGKKRKKEGKRKRETCYFFKILASFRGRGANSPTPRLNPPPPMNTLLTANQGI